MNDQASGSGTAIAVVGCGQLGELFVRTVQPTGALATVSSESSLARLADLPAEVRVLDLLDGIEPGHPLRTARQLVIAVAPVVGVDPVPLWTDGIAHLVAAADPQAHAVLISSTGVYAECAGCLVDESGTVGDTPRDRALLAAEEQVLKTFRRATVLRCSGLVGPRRGPQHYIEQLAGAERHDGGGWLNLVLMDDVVEALRRVLEGEVAGVFNCSGGFMRRRDFYDPLMSRAGLTPVRWQKSSGPAGRRVVSKKLESAIGMKLRPVDPSRLEL